MDFETEAGEEGESPLGCKRRLRTRAAKTQDKEENRGKKSRGHKRKAEINVEKLYLQENFKEPTPSPLETIFESPKLQKKRSGIGKVGEENAEALTFMSVKKVKRICNFPSYYGPPKLKTKQRKDKARKFSKVTGAKVPKGSGVSMEEVMAALASLSDSDDQLDANTVGFCNRTFSAPPSPPSSEFYCGNIIRPDTSETAVDYVIHNMSNLNVTQSDSQASNVNIDVMTEQLLLENPLPIDEEPTGQKNASREKRARRRSGRVTACPLIKEVITVSEKQSVQTDKSLGDSLHSGKDDLPLCELKESDTSPDDEKLRRVTACINEDEKLSLMSEKPTIKCSLKMNTALDDAPHPSNFSETLPDSSEDIQVMPPIQEKDVIPPTISSIKPVKKRVPLVLKVCKSDSSAIKDVTRKEAKERAKQRKPVQDTSEIAKKSQKLDLGQKRENNSKSESALVKKSKTSKMEADGESKSKVIRDHVLERERSSTVEQKAVSQTTLNAMLHQSSVLDVAKKNSSLPAHHSKEKDASRMGSIGKEGRKQPRFKRRVSGVERSLYRISLTKEDTPESSPVLSEDKNSSFSYNTSPNCTEICPQTEISDHGTNGSILKESGCAMWQSSLCASVLSAQNKTGLLIGNLESLVQTPVSGELVKTTAHGVPNSSTSLITAVNTQSSVCPTTTTCTSSFHAVKDGFKTARSPTSPSAQLAALSLQPDLLPSPTTPISIKKTKKKAKRRSSRLSFDHPKIIIEQATNSHLGSFWATSPALTKLGLNNTNNADECVNNTVTVASTSVRKLPTENTPGMENMKQEDCSVTELAQNCKTDIKQQYPKVKTKKVLNHKKATKFRKESPETPLEVRVSLEKMSTAKPHTKPPLSINGEQSESALTSVTNSSEPLLPLTVTRDHYDISLVPSLTARKEERKPVSQQSAHSYDPPSEQKDTNPTPKAQNEIYKCNSNLLPLSQAV